MQITVYQTEELISNETNLLGPRSRFEISGNIQRQVRMQIQRIIFARFEPKMLLYKYFSQTFSEQAPG